ncbi:cytochrome P450 [Collybia nuda]|uniref:Cytochrome P450 n=1 Tax=Collybia nuda TaxID=64659 RepID=A0A9P6CQ58_9AGAR|nr:cytochrome P450 [Collybia nuda]
MAELLLFSVPLSFLGITIFVLVASAIRRRLLGRVSLLPPGPPGFPMIGNISFLFTKSPWLQFTRWHRKYGPIVYIKIAGKSLVILNTAETAFDLLDRRGSNYTDRPRLIMAGELLAGGVHIGFIPHGPLWRKLRRLSHISFNSQACEKYFQTQELEAAFLINRLLNNSPHWEDRIQLFAASSILTIIYGRPPTTSMKDPLILRINNFMDCILKAAVPGSYWVDVFPVLNLVPSWMAPFKQFGMRAHQEFTDLFNQLLWPLPVPQKNTEGKQTFSAKIIDEYQQIGLSEKEASWLAGVMFGAGSDTTAAVLVVFVLAMLLNPTIMKKAQQEIDNVVGHDRLPNFTDRVRLPFINAIVKETLRWKPITPLGLARQATKDDIYNGYYIPAGSIVMTNVWAMNHNDEIYKNPSTFDPERYLGPDFEELKPGHTRGGTHAFGFGRRVCVGANIATNSVFIAIAHIIWAFDIAPSDLAPLPSPDDIIDTGVVVRPAPFCCKFTPRHQTREHTLDIFLSGETYNDQL